MSHSCTLRLPQSADFSRAKFHYLIFDKVQMRRGLSLYSELWTTWLSDSGATNFKAYYGSWDTLWERYYEWKSQKKKIHCFLSFSSFEKEVGIQKVPKFIFYHVETALLSHNFISPPFFPPNGSLFQVSDWFWVSAKSICWTNLGGKLLRKKVNTNLCLYLPNCITSNRDRHNFPVYFTCEYVLGWKPAVNTRCTCFCHRRAEFKKKGGYNICGCLET